jgi:hypothetical protein
MRHAPFIEVSAPLQRPSWGGRYPLWIRFSGIDAEQPVDEGRLGSAAHGLIQSLNWPFLNIRITSKPLILG